MSEFTFRKLEKKSARQKCDYPAIYVGKSNSTLNMAFCDKLGIKTVGEKFSFDLHYSENGDFFLIIPYTKDKNRDKGNVAATYQKSHQAQCYIKSMLQNAGYYMTGGVQCKVKKFKQDKIKGWSFKVPKDFKKSKDEIREEARDLAKKKKKTKRKKKNKDKLSHKE